MASGRPKYHQKKCARSQYAGVRDVSTHTQAEEFIEKVRRDTQEGRLSLPQGRKIAVGFREAATRYLDKLTEEGGKDLVAKRRRLTLHLVPFHAAMDALEARYTFQPLATAQRG